MKIKMSKKEKDLLGRVKDNWGFLAGIFLIIMSASIFVRGIIPITLAFISNIMALITLWELSKNEVVRFVGGIFFIIIGWKIYVFLINLCSKLLTISINLFNNKKGEKK